MGGIQAIPNGSARQDDLYQSAAAECGASLDRLVRTYEADPDRRRDLLQDIHFQIWRSFERYDARCSPRTWVYRVAHNVATSYVMKQRRIFSALVSLEELETLPDATEAQSAADQRLYLDRLAALVRRLKPLDRQIIVCYLEDMDANSIGEITGLSPGNIAVRIHRIKNILAQRFHGGGGGYA